jgi:arylformamidase
MAAAVLAPAAEIPGKGNIIDICRHRIGSVRVLLRTFHSIEIAVTSRSRIQIHKKEAFMSLKVPDGWYDISVPIKQGMNYLPIDPVSPKIYRLYDTELGAKVTMSMLEIISHTGTHIDTPLHFITGGSTVSDMPLDATIGPARVIEIKDPEKIGIQELEKHAIQKGERILCKTRNSPQAYESPQFFEDYVYLDSEAAAYLVEKGIILFGMDCITIGNIKDEQNVMKTHQTLLSAGVYILEDCALADVPPGGYELLCLPLLIYKGDAGPCRAILRPLRSAAGGG